MFQGDDPEAKKRHRGTLAQPSRTDAITSCSKVLHQHIWRSQIESEDTRRKPGSDQAAYDIDNFVQQQYTVTMPILPGGCHYTTFVQTPKVNVMPDLPDEKKIFTFCKRVVDRCRLNAECVIISLIYIERLMENTNITVSHRNWIPILVVALLTASKVWDDHSTFNGDLCVILPVFTVTDINDLERRFLTDLKYTLHIPFSDYAKYYFGLRALKKKDVRSIPKFYLRIGLGNARRVERRTMQTEATHRGMQNMSL